MSVEAVETARLKIPGLPETEARAADAGSAGADDSQRAWLEAASLSENKPPEQLAMEAAQNEHGRNQRFRDHFERLAIGALWLSSAAVGSIAAIWIWHLISPPKMRWLSTEDISHLQSIATAGLLVGVIGNHFKKRLN